jgi:hypothetical protein
MVHSCRPIFGIVCDVAGLAGVRQCHCGILCLPFRALTGTFMQSSWATVAHAVSWRTNHFVMHHFQGLIPGVTPHSLGACQFVRYDLAACAPQWCHHQLYKVTRLLAVTRLMSRAWFCVELVAVLATYPVAEVHWWLRFTEVYKCAWRMHCLLGWGCLVHCIPSCTTKITVGCHDALHHVHVSCAGCSAVQDGMASADHSHLGVRLVDVRY